MGSRGLRGSPYGWVSPEAEMLLGSDGLERGGRRGCRETDRQMWSPWDAALAGGFG